MAPRATSNQGHGRLGSSSFANVGAAQRSLRARDAHQEVDHRPGCELLFLAAGQCWLRLMCWWGLIAPASVHCTLSRPIGAEIARAKFDPFGLCCALVEYQRLNGDETRYRTYLRRADGLSSQHWSCSCRQRRVLAE